MGLLRFILALSVLLEHLWGHFHISVFGYQIVGGEVAVVEFFIISGFYMSLILNEKYIGRNKSYFLYITNRFLRIYPLYWLILMITFLYSSLNGFSLIKYTYVFYDNVLNIANLLQNIIQNITLIFTSSYLVYIPKLYTNLYVDPAWSLSIELAFYLIAPFIVKGGFKKLLLILILAFALRTYTTHINIFYPVYSLPFLFLPNLFFFVLGGFSYQIYRKIKDIKFNAQIYYFAIIPIMLIMILYNFIPTILFYTFNRYLLYLITFISLPFLFLIEKKIKFSYFLGELSYPIYISHLLTLSIISHLSIIKFNKNLDGFIDIVIVLVMAFILKKIISDPIDSFRAARVKNKPPPKTLLRKKRS